MSKIRFTLKLSKPRNPVAADMFRSGASKPKVENAKNKYTRKTKHKKSMFSSS
jgi:hypothetical protein